MEEIKVGEIKAHSIMLICPEVEISYDVDDEDSLTDTIESLRCDPNIRDIALGIVPSINRAFSLIEKRGGTRKKSKTLRLEALEKIGRRSRVPLVSISPDILFVESIYFENGEKIPFDVECDDEIYIHSQKNGEYTFIYSTRLKRLTEATSDNEDIDLDEGIAEIIPYFVKSELIASENSEESNASRLLFDGILKELTAVSRGSTNQVVDTVYFFE